MTMELKKQVMKKNRRFDSRFNMESELSMWVTKVIEAFQMLRRFLSGTYM